VFALLLAFLETGEVEVRDVFGEKHEKLEWIPFKPPT
jgi:hypothetical protein